MPRFDLWGRRSATRGPVSPRSRRTRGRGEWQGRACAVRAISHGHGEDGAPRPKRGLGSAADDGARRSRWLASAREWSVSRFAEWLESRTGYRGILKDVLEEPVRGGARWAYVFGSVLTFLLALQVLTGVLLASF